MLVVGWRGCAVVVVIVAGAIAIFAAVHLRREYHQFAQMETPSKAAVDTCQSIDMSMSEHRVDMSMSENKRLPFG